MKYLLIITIALLLSCDLEQPKQREYTVRISNFVGSKYFEIDYYENTNGVYKFYKDSTLYREVAISDQIMIMITKNESSSNN